MLANALVKALTPTGPLISQAATAACLGKRELNARFTQLPGAIRSVFASEAGKESVYLMADYVAAIDQGTTSTRCMLFNYAGESVGIEQLEHKQIYPKPGWVEHDPLEIWTRTQEAVKGALRKVNATAADIAAIGITSQRETTVIWDRKTGKPSYNAVVWQDTRTDEICAALGQSLGQDRFRSRVGLPLATYFSAPKIKWLLDNVDGLRASAEKGDAIFGNVDSWLIWNLTGGSNGGAHVTDVSNASRTMLMVLEETPGMTKCWRS